MSDEIKGRSAFKGGQVRGKARFLFASDPDLDNFKDGDILVSDMTAPNMMPAIRRAGAIATVKGGITCHAAIVAREFKIPTVVGCGEALSNLIRHSRSFDLIEGEWKFDLDEMVVDSDRGVVTVCQ